MKKRSKCEELNQKRKDQYIYKSMINAKYKVKQYRCIKETSKGVKIKYKGPEKTYVKKKYRGRKEEGNK